MPKRKYSKKRSYSKKKSYSKKRSYKGSYKRKRTSFKRGTYKKKRYSFMKNHYVARGKRLLAAPMMGSNRAHYKLISRGLMCRMKMDLLNVAYIPIAANLLASSFATPGVPTGAVKPWEAETNWPDINLPTGYLSAPPGIGNLGTKFQRYLCTGGSMSVQASRLEQKDDAVIHFGLLPITRDQYSKLIVPGTYANAYYWPAEGNVFSTANPVGSWQGFVNQPGVVRGMTGSVAGGLSSQRCFMKTRFKTSALSDEMAYYTDNNWWVDSGSVGSNVLFYLLGIYGDGDAFASGTVRLEFSITMTWNVTAMKPRESNNYPQLSHEDKLAASAIAAQVSKSESKEEKVTSDDDDMELEAHLVKLSTSSPPSIHVTGPPPDGKPVLASSSIPAPALIPPHSKMLGRPAKKS